MYYITTSLLQMYNNYKHITNKVSYVFFHHGSHAKFKSFSESMLKNLPKATGLMTGVS